MLLIETLCKPVPDTAISAALEPRQDAWAVHCPGKIRWMRCVVLDGDCLADTGILRSEPEVEAMSADGSDVWS